MITDPVGMVIDGEAITNAKAKVINSYEASTKEETPFIDAHTTSKDLKDKLITKGAISDVDATNKGRTYDVIDMVTAGKG